MDKEKKTSLQLANQAFRDKNYALALSLYSKFIKLTPELKDLVSFNLKLCMSRLGSGSLEQSNELLVGGELVSIKVKSSLETLTPEQINEINFIENYQINFGGYFKANNLEEEKDSAVTHYVKNWKNNDLVIPNFFDTEFYLMAYPDIKDSGMNPLLHFVKHGQHEGRKGRLDENAIAKGGIQFDKNKETVVFVSHESSATGAPLLGYGIASKLLEKYNVIHIVLKKENIHDLFVNGCDVLLHDVRDNAFISSYFFLKRLLKERTIKCVLINSVVGYQVMYAAYKLNIPIVFLIHEFAEYMRPFGTMIDVILHADYVVTPAKIIQDSMLKELKRFTGQKVKPSNISIYPQGKLPFIPDSYGENDSVRALYKKMKIDDPTKVKIIVGSGFVQIRKGVDLFISVARYIKKIYGSQCKFVWVGDGFNPDNDLAFSVYLEREIQFSGLEDDFIFLEHQKNLDTIFSIADVFCMSSRMDPFPNVVIDALNHDLHIACFEHASGSADFLKMHDANASIVEFVDTYSMAESISSYLRADDTKKGINKRIVKDHLDFNKYVDYLDSLMTDAVRFKSNADSMISSLLQSKFFDSEFCGGAGDEREKCRRYVEYGLKGIHFYNPKPGFSEIDWIYKHSPENSNIVPLYEAIKANDVEKHQVVTLPMNNQKRVSFCYAVHLHLYYLDMATYFIQYFKNLPAGYDLYISIVDEYSVEMIKDSFMACGASSVVVVSVDNIGRDIAPLIFTFKEQILAKSYDVIGHFHSKKSLELDSGGDRWLEYLMQTLIGDSDNAHDIHSIFADPSVGLIFPEDRNACDIGDNKTYVAELCQMLGIAQVEQTATFPVGNMFWAKTDAIKELFYLKPELILQEEPLPYDGSYMHAIERITPFLAQKNGYTYTTVYKKGVAWK